MVEQILNFIFSFHVHLLQFRKGPKVMGRAVIPFRLLYSQVFLMLLLCIIPLRGSLDLGRDGLALIPLISDLLLDLFRNLQLLIVLRLDASSVLRASIGTLSVQCCRVVHFEEVFHQLRVSHPVWVEDNQK